VQSNNGLLGVAHAIAIGRDDYRIMAKCDRADQEIGWRRLDADASASIV
jgi:hypothetical protein